MKWWQWILGLLIGLAIFHFRYGLIIGVGSENLFWGDVVIVMVGIAMMLVQGIKKLRESREIAGAQDREKE